MLHAIGIGDLHLDGKLRKHIPDLNQVIVDNVTSVLDRAVKRGIKYCFLYGDICDKPVMSSDALQKLLRLFHTYSQVRFLVIKGNHDTHDDQTSSLDSLHLMTELGMLDNVRIVRDKPVTLFGKTDHPVRLLPWPHKDTLKGHLNVLHVEALGAKWDTGRDVTEGVDTPHLCVIGHIHTSQRVRNMHFSGTLYQTNFGESQEKYYHEITWTGSTRTSEIKLVRHRPTYLLHNVVIRTEDDYNVFIDKAIAADSTSQANYYKVFVNSKDVLLPISAFDKVPGVIKLNSFRSKAELNVLMTEELELDDVSGQLKFSTDVVLQDWMKQNDVDVDLRDRALAKLSQLVSRSMPQAVNNV